MKNASSIKKRVVSVTSFQAFRKAFLYASHERKYRANGKPRAVCHNALLELPALENTAFQPFFRSNDFTRPPT